MPSESIGSVKASKRSFASDWMLISVCSNSLSLSVPRDASFERSGTGMHFESVDDRVLTLDDGFNVFRGVC